MNRFGNPVAACVYSSSSRAVPKAFFDSADEPIATDTMSERKAVIAKKGTEAFPEGGSRLNAAGMHFAAFLFSMLVPLAMAGAADQPPALPNAFGAFNLSFNSQPAAKQAELLTKLGYDGIMVGTWEDHAPWTKLKSFAEVPEVRDGRLKVFGILWGANVATKYDAARLDELASVSARLHAPLWVYVAGKSSQRGEAVTLLQDVADRCARLGGSLVLYPHEGHVFSDAEGALVVLKAMNRPAVKISIHLCHELKAGNAERLDEVIANIAPHLALASINGADASVGFQEPGWATTIMPLDRGSFDVQPFVASLAKRGYRGPILQHTFGLKSPPEEHLGGSIKRWREISAAVGRVAADKP